MPERFPATSAIIRGAVARRAFPAAAIEVGRAAGPLWNQAFGTLTYDPGAFIAAPDTIFDIASLTKVIATTTLVMRAVDEGRLTLDAPISTWLSEWRGTDRELRQHPRSAGALLRPDRLPAVLPRDPGPPRFPGGHLRAAARVSRRGRSRSTATSDSSCSGSSSRTRLERMPHQRPEHHSPPTRARSPRSSSASPSSINARALTFNPPRANQRFTAPTEVDPWRGRLLVGEVHDENCWALGGAAGHAGLFGTAAAVGAFARVALRTISGRTVLAQPADDARVHHARLGARQLARPRLGHDAPHLVVRQWLSPSQSATRGSRARHCGLIGSAISTWCS